MSGARLELRGVEVRRGGRRILAVDALAVAPGKFLGVVGVNGAGKTTLLRVCGALLRPSAGQVSLDGVDVASALPWRRTAARRAVGYVPQATDYNAHLPLTVEEVVGTGRDGRRGLLRRRTQEDRRLVQQWVQRLGLEALAGRTFRSLSGGEQQKALIARAMVQQPSLLLLDEPAANLDLDWKARIIRLLEELYRACHLTIVMVSHETGMLPASCGRVALMRAGRVLRAGPPEAVLTPAALAAVYGCPVTVAEVQGRRQAVAREGGPG
ncbi:MAG: ABC transporter ATP-binding protein [bacterium]